MMKPLQTLLSVSSYGGTVWRNGCPEDEEEDEPDVDEDEDDDSDVVGRCRLTLSDPR
jgi:hypothetical protein